MRIPRNRFLFRVKPVNSDLPQKQPQKVALFVERNAADGLLEVQKVLGHKVLVRHRPLAIRDVDLHLLDFPFQLVLLLRQVLRSREGFTSEVRGIGFANHREVTLEFLAHVGVLALKLRELCFQGADGLALFLVGGGHRRLDDFRPTANLAQNLDHEVIHCPSGNIAKRASRGLAVLADVVAGVIEVGIAVPVLLAARLGREPVAALAAADDALQESLMHVAVEHRVFAFLPFATQGIIGFLPELFTHQRFVLAGIVLPVVVNDSLIQRVGDDDLDFVRDEPLAPDDHFIAPATLHHPFRGAQPFRVQCASHLRGAA